MTTNQPLVSVFLATYNQQDFIDAAIESVLSQDYGNIEIVIGDDCSTDNTWQIIQEYQSKFPEKIKAFRNPRNLGITGNCNEIQRRCTGKYIAYLAGDDLYLPGKISTQLTVMERDQDVVLSYHDIEVFNSEDGRTLRYWNHGPFSSQPVAGSSRMVAKAVVEEGAFMAALSVMVRRDVVPASGFDDRVPVASDWLMWIEILAGCGRDKKVEFVPNVLARYRRHSTNVTGENYEHTSDEFVTLAIVESKYPVLARSARKGYARVRYGLGVRLILNNNPALGRNFLVSSLLPGWFSWKIAYWLVASFIPALLRQRGTK